MEALIEELTAAAEEAIENAAARAAKAASLAALDREAAAVAEARRLRGEAEAAKKSGVRNVIMAALICFAGGFVLGSGRF